MSHLIAPSLLSANFNRLGEEIEMINKSEADWFHLDVMDGVFVPNISFGMPIIKAIARMASKPLDTHLMIVQPERYFETFRDLGVNILSIHYEAVIHLNRAVNQIKELGMKAGVVLNPHTPIAMLTDIINDVDVILIMSVNPGFGGQKFIEGTYDRIKQLKKMIMDTGSAALIEVDGGVSIENAPLLKAAGADVLVAGNTVFGSSNPTQTISQLKHLNL